MAVSTTDTPLTAVAVVWNNPRAPLYSHHSLFRQTCHANYATPLDVGARPRISLSLTHIRRVIDSRPRRLCFKFCTASALSSPPNPQNLHLGLNYHSPLRLADTHESTTTPWAPRSSCKCARTSDDSVSSGSVVAALTLLSRVFCATKNNCLQP